MRLFLFADKLPPEIGGMETHAKYFVQYFASKSNLYIISKKGNDDILVDNDFKIARGINIIEFLSSFSTEKCVVFYNSGRWIEDFDIIKGCLPLAVFIYRTGGNEIIKAPLSKLNVNSHLERQKIWSGILNRNIDFLIANSEFTYQRLIKIGIKKEIITILSGGIDSKNIKESLKKRANTRLMLKCPNSIPLLVCCCRFVPYKRPQYIIQSLLHLNIPYQMVFVGNGPLLEECMHLVKQINLKNCTFLGELPQQQALDIIACADVYCQASCDLEVPVQCGKYIHTEGMGRSLLESICCGTRVVVTKCGAVNEFINNNNGIVVDGSEELFAHSIETVLSLPRISQELRQTYIERYNFEGIFTSYMYLWQKRF